MKLVTISPFEAQLKRALLYSLSSRAACKSVSDTSHERSSMKCSQNCVIPSEVHRTHLWYFILPGAVLRATPQPAPQAELRCAEGWQMCRGQDLNNSLVTLGLMEQDNGGSWEPWSPMATCRDASKQRRQRVFMRRPGLLNRAWIQRHLFQTKG